MDAWQIVSAPRRREILRLVWSEELPAGEIAARSDVTFGAISQHLALLREAGYVTARRQGNHIYYRANRKGLGPFAKVLEGMWSATLDDLASAVERDQRRPGT